MIMQFNVLWLNPREINTFPEGLIDALDDRSFAPMLLSQHDNKNTNIESRLRQQMQADALRPISSEIEDDPDKAAVPTHEWSSDTIQEASQYLRLNVCDVFFSRDNHSLPQKRQARDRLHLLLSYLRDNYAYCFWCGTQYNDNDDMDVQCPGENEEDHD
jgi:hypothetical protein